jgi:hypothetical protein
VRTRIRLVTLILAIGALLAPLPPAESSQSIHLSRPKHGFRIRTRPFTIPAAHEREVCEYRRLPNRRAMDVQQFEFLMSEGSHHFAVWAYLGSDRNPEDFPHAIVSSPGCTGLGPRDSYNREILGGAGQPHERVSFPPGIAVRIAPHQQVFLNSHYINGSLTEPLTPMVLFNVIPARKGSVKHHAENLTIGNYNILVPGESTAALTSEWIAPFDMNVIQLSSHEHKRGTRVTIRQVVDGQDAGQIFENDDWSHPYEYWPVTPMRVKQGDAFRFTCEWKNDDAYPVTFGVTTNDEMCFMTGYYYRDDESQPVPHLPGCFAQPSGLLCSATTVN